MLQLGRVLSIAMVGMAMQVGCRDNTPPVPRVAPPAPGYDTVRRDYDPPKPMPGQEPALAVAAAPQPFEDEPLLVDTPLEAKRYVDIYRQVGRPRLVVFVNRTLEGQLIPSSGGDAGPVRTVERTRKSTGSVTVETKEYVNDADYQGQHSRDNSDKFQSAGPAEYVERTEEYLQPGEYDEISAKAIDYGMMETLLTDWLSADGQVAMVTPMLAQKKLSAQQLKDLQSGQGAAMQEIAEQLDADILIQVQARITRQTPQGPSVRILAEAMNTRGADSLARAAVDMDPPLDKRQLNKYTRFLARKLMDGMAATWSQPAVGAPQDRGASAPPPPSDKGMGPRLTPEAPATTRP
ncbi:MAG TPA: hypothetical protein VHP11_15550 [Tepidisphaeraceae bacterium]|nr:hypothetical protein [Tepidisphaeraceae bacterium]